MCIYSPMPHTLSYCALIGKCALIRSNTVCVAEPITPLVNGKHPIQKARGSRQIPSKVEPALNP